MQETLNVHVQAPKTVPVTVRVLTTFDAVTFLIAASLHAGLQIPLGFTRLAEPQIVPATIVEGFAGLGLAVSASAAFARRPWAWAATLAADVFAFGGVLLGMAALAAGRGPRTQSNDIYHRVMLVLLALGIILLLLQRNRETEP